MRQFKTNGNSLSEPISGLQSNSIIHMPAIKHIEAAVFPQVHHAYYQEHYAPRLIIHGIIRLHPEFITVMIWNRNDYY